MKIIENLKHRTRKTWRKHHEGLHVVNHYLDNVWFQTLVFIENQVEGQLWEDEVK